MTRTSSTSEREPTGIPATVRCRPDPDGIVVWVPADEPTDDEDDEMDDGSDERGRYSPYVDQG
jgi:hypothetical protein